MVQGFSRTSTVQRTGCGCGGARAPIPLSQLNLDANLKTIALTPQIKVKMEPPKFTQPSKNQGSKFIYQNVKEKEIISDLRQNYPITRNRGITRENSYNKMNLPK